MQTQEAPRKVESVTAAGNQLRVLDPTNPANATQLTHSSTGVLNFDISPDGTQIFYSFSTVSDKGQNEMRLMRVPAAGGVWAPGQPRRRARPRPRESGICS